MPVVRMLMLALARLGPRRVGCRQHRSTIHRSMLNFITIANEAMRYITGIPDPCIWAVEMTMNVSAYSFEMSNCVPRKMSIHSFPSA